MARYPRVSLRLTPCRVRRRSILSDIPAGLIWGGADRAFPAAMRERLASVFDDCQVSVHDGIGHFVAEELGVLLVPEVASFLQSDS